MARIRRDQVSRSATLASLLVPVCAGWLVADPVVADPVHPMVAERVQTLPGPASTFPQSLVVAGDGSVYGTTGLEIFKVDLAGVFSSVHTFAAGEGTVQNNSLVVGNDGAVYGLNYGYSPNGPSQYIPTVFFRLDTQGNITKTVLNLPSYLLAADMKKGSDGAFYASLQSHYVGEVRAFDGGVARITSTGTFTMVGGNRGQSHPHPLAIGADGALYGARADSQYWGEHGSIVRWDNTTGQATDIYDFTSLDEVGPRGFTLAPNGLVYAVTGGGQAGFIYSFDTIGNVSAVHTFDFDTDGGYPSPLTLGSDGALYGLTQSGGALGVGTVFRLPTNGPLAAIFPFDFSNGGYPEFPLVAAQNGALYGVGGFGIPGAAIIRVTPPTTVDTFPLLPPDSWPKSALVQGSDCALYGIGEEWGTDRQHFVYRAFEAGQLCQQISFAPLPDRTLGDPPFAVSATSSSTLPVSFAASGACTISGDQVTLVGGGVCAITASQPGDARFGPAAPVTQEFQVSPGRACDDGFDNDFDGLTDHADPDCGPSTTGIEETDVDSDGVAPGDNCALVANPSQLDSNLDGYGNLCDGDFNDDGMVGIADLNAFKRAYWTIQGAPGYDADIDLNEDGAVNPADFIRFRSMYLAPPGPSGLTCAGSTGGCYCAYNSCGYGGG